MLTMTKLSPVHLRNLETISTLCSLLFIDYVLSLLSVLVLQIPLVMVRCYSTKGIKNWFSDEDLTNALRDLKEKKGSIRKFASIYGLPYTTLHAHHTGISKKPYGGPSTALTYEEEREIVQSCIVLQEMGFPIDKATLGQPFHLWYTRSRLVCRLYEEVEESPCSMKTTAPIQKESHSFNQRYCG